MAIDDPTAIPETTEQVAEYVQEADRLWNDSRTEDAHVLYRGGGRRTEPRGYAFNRSFFGS